MRATGVGIAAVLSMGCAAAAAGELNNFKDWVVACDNTRACEAQGYATEDAAVQAVLVVRREAGPGTLPQMRLGFGTIDLASGGEAPQPPPGRAVGLRAGPLQLALSAATEGWIDLDAMQARALLPALRHEASLAVEAGALRWTVSLAGAGAALGKIDAVQGRVGRMDALARPGPRAAAAAPRAPGLPRLRAPTAPATRLSPGAEAALRRAVAAAIPAGACPLPRDDAGAADAGELVRADTRRVIVSLPCWMAAYQGGSGAWIANLRPPHAPRALRFQQPDGRDGLDQPTELTLSRAADGRIAAFSVAKGRGPGDCMSTRQWLWDGRRFALQEASVSPCRMFGLGGVPLTLWRARLVR